MSSQLPSKSPTVIFKEMDDGGVLFCSRSEGYFGLNSVGVKIWEQLPESSHAGGRSFGELLSTLGDNYPDVDRDMLAADALELLAAMAECELVIGGSNQ